MALSIDSQRLILDRYVSDVQKRIETLDSQDFVARFWKKDADLWGGGSRTANIVNAMGWIDVVSIMQGRIEELESFAKSIYEAGFTRAVLAGMGGSSLAPYVLANCIGKQSGGIPVHVLDSTNPDTVLEIERAGDLEKTLFIVASKSGSTAEPTAFDHYFFDLLRKGDNFVAITDPGSPFEAAASERNWRHIFLNFADIGGRFSALSYFGLVPAALMGIDLRKLLDAAALMVAANGPDQTVGSAPGFHLGAALGELALSGMNKLTFVTAPELSSLGLWMEQLVAESTGKEGKGILPIAGEALGAPSVYGRDRVFAYLRSASSETPEIDTKVAALEHAGHPIITIQMDDPYDLAQEFFRFEIATATVGAILDINPFDQPNVQESKDITKKVLQDYEDKGAFDPSPEGAHEGLLSVYGDTCSDTVKESLQKFFFDEVPGDYISIQAYLHETPELYLALSHLQAKLRDLVGLATTLGFGPRFLHSTGQFHKGGPNCGFFIQITGEVNEDRPIPGQAASWKIFELAQAKGDLAALNAKGRRTLQIHFIGDALAATVELTKHVENALTKANGTD